MTLSLASDHASLPVAYTCHKRGPATRITAVAYNLVRLPKQLGSTT